MNEPLVLTNKQVVDVAQLSNVHHTDVRSIVEAINDVFFSDPPGTIRRHPSGDIIAVKQFDMRRPWKTFCPNGSASWMSNSIATWPVIFSPGSGEQ